MPRAIEVAGNKGPTISYQLSPTDAFTALGLSVTYDLSASGSAGYLLARFLAPDGALIGWQKIGCGNDAGASLTVSVSALAPDVIVEDTLGNLGITQPLLQLPLITNCTIELRALKESDDSLDSQARLSQFVLWVDDNDGAESDTSVVAPYTALSYDLEAEGAAVTA